MVLVTSRDPRPRATRSARGWARRMVLTITFVVLAFIAGWIARGYFTRAQTRHNRAHFTRPDWSQHDQRAAMRRAQEWM